MAPRALPPALLALLAGTASGLRQEDVGAGSGGARPSAPLVERLAAGDTLECEGTWKIEKVLGSGGQGKVFAVRQGTDPIRAMKMDIATGGAYHTGHKNRALYVGMPHESVPECGILEALEASRISAAPRCYAACQLEGYNTLVMTKVDTWKRAYLKEWEGMAPATRGRFADENVRDLFEVIRGGIMPADVEAYVGRDERLRMLDYGGAFRTDYQSTAKHAGGSLDVLFQGGLPYFHGLGSVAGQICGLDLYDRRAKGRYEALLPEFSRLLAASFCRLAPDFEGWVAVTAKAAIEKRFTRCGKKALPADFLTCPPR